MTKRTFKKRADEAKYRVSMKRRLRLVGCQFDNDETTEQLEEMMRVCAPRVEQFDGVVDRASDHSEYLEYKREIMENDERSTKEEPCQ